MQLASFLILSLTALILSKTIAKFNLIMQIMVSKFGLFVCGLAFAMHFSSCTYAPRNTKVDQTYNARQMAVGIDNQESIPIKETTHEEIVPPLGDSQYATPLRLVGKVSNEFNDTSACASDFLTIGSSKKDVARLQGTPSRIVDFGSTSWWYYGDSRIDFNSRDQIESWDNSDRNLNLRMIIK
jgi:hypothetical protein